MRKDEVTITVAGACGSGKTTILREIQLALEKAGIKKMKVVSDDRLDHLDQYLGKRLDILAERVRKGELTITLKETQVIKSLGLREDIPF